MGATLSKPEFTFRCQFLGVRDVTSKVMCAEAFKGIKERIKLLVPGDRRTDHELCIGRTLVWMRQGGTEVKEHTHDIRRLSFITQDPVDKTVFGYVYSSAKYTYKLYAFKSEEENNIQGQALELMGVLSPEPIKIAQLYRAKAEVIIKTLREYMGDATNVMKEAAGSLYDRKNDEMTSDNFYGLEVGSIAEVPISDDIPRYGIIRWMGNMPQVKEKLVVGLELEMEESACSDGTFGKERYFTCPAGKGFFVLLENCRPDSRSDQRLTEKEERDGNGHRLVTELEQRVTHLNDQLREKQQLEGNLRQQLAEMEQQVTNLRGQIQERNEQLRDVTQEMTIVRGQLQEKDDETANLRNQATALRQQLEEKDQEMNELETTLSAAQDELREYRRQQSPDWVISRDHIQLTGKFLGRGGWGSVVQGKYCGCSVAVKQIHELILSPYNRELFEREMDIASKCRHPCLLQFIGATNDEGNPLFVTELMETSLRTLLEQRALSEAELSVVSLDVTRALNYLHQKQPFPIIHRDISSANVLLWRQGEHWRGKVSDYGTAKFMQQTMTVAPGAMIYSAPEALTKNQTVKVDVYSFGVLFCEMCIRELPNPERRDRQVAMVKNKLNRALIRGCLQSEPEARPSIQEIIDELEEPV